MQILRTANTIFKQRWLLVLALLLTGGFIAYSLFEERAIVEIKEKERLTSQAQIIEKNLGRQIEGVDHALKGILGDMEYWSGKGDRQMATRHLQTLTDAMPGVRTLATFDAQGTVMASNRSELIGKNFQSSGREYFKQARQGADPGQVYLSAPFKTALGVYAVVLSRRVIDVDGKFAGVVTATLDPEYFTILLDSVRSAPDMRVSLASSGKIFTMVPHVEGLADRDLDQPNSFYARHAQSGQAANLFSGRVTATGEERMMALRTIRPVNMSMNNLMVVAVSRDLPAVFARWRGDAHIQGGLFGLLALVSIASLFFYQHRQQAYDRLAASRELERRAAEQTLMRYAAIVEASDAAIIGKTLDGIITSWNKGAEQIFGYNRDEILGKRISQLIPEQRQPEEDMILQKIRDGIPVNQYETVRRRKDGKLINISVTISPLRDAAGKVVGASKVARDITELKQAEEQLRIVATAFDSQEPMMITDANTVIQRANRAFTESTGYSVAELVGQTPRLLKSGRHDTAFYAAMWESINRHGSWQGEIWDRRKNGEIYPNWTTITAIKGDDGTVTHYVGARTDITLRKAAEEEIEHLAFFDPLTSLPNRRLLMDRLRQSLTASVRSGREGALMFIDLDNFKTLNDTLGHDKGDLLLQQVAERLSACVREGDSVARLGGDEFVVLLEELSENSEEAATQAERVGEKILAALNQPYDLAGYQHHSTPSIGVTLFTGQRRNIAELLKQADLAMYQAKAAGRNAMRFFDPQMQTVVTARAEMEIELRQALPKREFILHYQAQVDCEDRLTGAEALVRWTHPQRGLVPPAEFIRLAEETGLILPLGQWVLERACAQLAAWSNQPDTGHLTMAVNVSASQFRRPDYVAQVLTALDQTGADPQKLRLEITESLLLDDVEDIILKMTALQYLGVRFSLDNFGTGYSSLAYLKRMPLDQLKIDRSFVRDVLIDHNDAAIARTIMALGQTLGLAVIAVGVETKEQRAFLADNRCNAYQGFLFSHPLPQTEFEQFLRRI